MHYLIHNNTSAEVELQVYLKCERGEFLKGFTLMYLEAEFSKNYLV